MPSYTRDRAGKLKLSAGTDNPDQAEMQARQRAEADKVAAAEAKPEKK